MASSRDVNLQRNWRGADRNSSVKKVGPYYASPESNSSVGQLVIGTRVTYIDSLTRTYQRAAIRFAGDQTVYYTLIDNLVKPGTENQLPALGPSSFGLANTTFNSPTDYEVSLYNAINNRPSSDINGELFDYLYQLINYAKTGVHDYTGIYLTGFPWGQVQNYFAELLGPLVCCNRSILSSIIPTSLGSAKIYIPPDSERLYDYKLIVGTNEYLISAKSARGVSNQVKPQFVVKSGEESGKLGLLQNTTEFNLLRILGNETVVSGALKGWGLIAPNEMPPDAIQSIISVYRGESHGRRLPDPSLLVPFVTRHMPSRLGQIDSITVGEIRYKCEQLIQNWSKSGGPNNILKQIFNIYLNESRVIYVKMDINKTDGRPTFTASAGGGSNLVNSLYLRSSNYATRTADRIGFQVS